MSPDVALRDEIIELLLPGRVFALFQPIVRPADNEVIGYEALARMRARRDLSPDRWLARADQVGLRAELELACWGAAATVGAPPGDRLLFVNAGPAVLLDPRFDELRTKLPERLVIELSQQDAVTDYEPLRARLRVWANDGVRLAIDDTGPGDSSLKQVLQLSPDFVKLDRSLVSGVHRDGKLRALVDSIVAFAGEMGATVVAEGVEAGEDLQTLQVAGVQLVQGFLLGQPDHAWPKLQRRVRAATRPREADDHRLDRELRAASNIQRASEVVCEHLFRLGQLMPSVYLAYDGLLRCQAQRGYWQVLDGIPASAGVTGRAFNSGTAMTVDATADPDFLEASPGIVAEVAVPLVVGDHVVGVLNAESLCPVAPNAVNQVGRCARLLSERLAELGVTPPDTPLARLARMSNELAGLTDELEVRAAVTRLACEVAGMDSAMLALRDDGDVFTIAETTGPFAAAFRAMPGQEIGRLASLVERVSSCYTAGDATGRTVVGTETLRAAGAAAVAVLPLVAGGRRSGVLVVADARVRSFLTDDIEPLELLASEAARCLELASTVAALRWRATRDPLTGLENHSAFYEALEHAAIGDAVAMLDVDGFKAVNDTYGHPHGDGVLRELAANLEAALMPGDRIYRIGGDEFAAIFSAADAPTAIARVERLRAAALPVLARHKASVTAGVALVKPGLVPASIVDRADRTLYDAKRGGGDITRIAPADCSEPG